MELFDFVPVTEADVELWLDTVPVHLGTSKTRRENYRKAYRVEEKIAAAKLRGEWPPEKHSNGVPPDY
jgi:hypothetical protein